MAKKKGSTFTPWGGYFVWKNWEYQWCKSIEQALRARQEARKEDPDAYIVDVASGDVYEDEI